MKCNKCNTLFKNNGACIKHQNNCKLVKNIIEEYNSGISLRSLSINYKSTPNIIKKFLENNNVSIRTELENLKIKSINGTKRRHSEETKKKMSEDRKKYLKENPDKHPWKKDTKFISIPCENFKKVLDELNIKYLPEYTPSDDRAFSIDILLPQYKIAIEVNGNQHYNKNATLKAYYQERHDFISNLGYEVYELHYSLFFNNNKMITIINSIIDNKPLFDFNYEEYLIKTLNKVKLNKNKKLCKCGKEICVGNTNCGECNALLRRKVVRPELSVLLEDIKKLGYRGAGKKYNVSDASIKKWIKNYKLFTN